MRILGYILVVLFVTTSAMGQQINPVPDYIFRNQMSVGRNAPTDTAAYLSVGPRYGANKGLMPPMVVDTNAVTGTKRNGLLIFSVQLNNFAYWDSTTSRFRKITADAVVDSLVFSTRAWRKKGDDSLGAVIAVKTDTALLSTKAYRQKAVDSLVTLISTLGGGTVLSVGSGYGTNFSTITTSGSVVVDSLVITSRASRDKLKDSLNANIALKVNISDTATMLGAYLRKADTTAMLTPYLRKADTTSMLSPYVRIAGYGLLKGTQTLSVDSALMATRARVQKGIDSVASLVTTTDSVVFSTRAWRQKGVDSVAALANTKATATGTTNYLSKFTGTSSLGNSIVYATTSEVGISTPSPTHPLDVNGRVRVRTIDSTATGMNMLYADVDGVIKKAAIPAGGSGSVTSVAAGTGMSFSTITTTGSVNADTLALSTRAWRQKGIDSVAGLSRVTGSGTTNRVAKFTASGAVGNSSIADSSSSVELTILSNGNTGLNTSTPQVGFDINRGISQAASTTSTPNGSLLVGTNATSAAISIGVNGGNAGFIQNRSRIAASWFDLALNPNGGNVGIGTGAPSYLADVNGTMRSTGNTFLATTASNEVIVGGTTDAGAHTLQVIGNIYNTTGAVLAATSGNVGIRTTSPTSLLDIQGTNASTDFRITRNISPDIYLSISAPGNTPNRSEISINGTNVLSLTVNKNVGIAQTVFGTNATNTFAISSGTAPTTSPADAFQMYSADIEAANAAPHIRTENGTILTLSEKLGTKTSKTLSLSTKDTGRVMIDTLGNVGIATTSPSERLHVNGRARIATIDSSASPINMLWADVNGVIRKAPVASGGVSGSGTTNFIPKFTGSTALGNSAMYDSSGLIRMIVNSIGNVDNNKIGFHLITDGRLGYTSIFQQNDSITNGRQYPLALRKGLLAGTPSAGNGVGILFQHQDDALAFRDAGFIANRIDDSSAANFKSQFFFSLLHAGSSRLMMRLKSDSTVFLAKMVGTGTRYVQANASGELSAPAIDSSGTAINMLYAGTDGVIRKAPVPASSVVMSTDEMTAASGWTIAYDKTQAYPVNDVNKTVDGSIATVTINTAAYRTTATFNTDQWVHVATVPSGFRPNSDVYFSLPNTVAGASFRSTSSVGFTSYNFYQEEASVRVLPNGNVEVFVGLVSNSADLSGANYVIMPIAVTYNIETYPN